MHSSSHISEVPELNAAGVPSGRIRLDVLLVERGLFDSRSQAAAAILAGEVFVGTGRDRALKPGQQMRPDAEIDVGEGSRFVSRGGIKLDNALADLEIDVTGKSCLDVGASTGGFTDCLLSRDAERVIALDVAYGELAWKIRQDPRVTVIERCNARHMQSSDLPWPPDLVVCDVSFIGLAKVLPAIRDVAAPGADILALVKPQFEVGRDRIGAGVVRDPDLRRETLIGVGRSALAVGLDVRAFASSGLPGPKGNRESFIHLVRQSPSVRDDSLERLARRAEP